MADNAEVAQANAVAGGFKAEACQAQSNEEGKPEEALKLVFVALAALLFVAILTAVEWLGDRQQLRYTAAQQREVREGFRDSKSDKSTLMSSTTEDVGPISVKSLARHSGRPARVSLDHRSERGHRRRVALESPRPWSSCSELVIPSCWVLSQLPRGAAVVSAGDDPMDALVNAALTGLVDSLMVEYLSL